MTYLSLLICYGNYDMFLIMQMNLTCRSFQRTSNDSSKEEPESSRVKDTIAKERASEEDKEDPPREMKTTLGTRNNPR